MHEAYYVQVTVARTGKRRIFKIPKFAIVSIKAIPSMLRLPNCVLGLTLQWKHHQGVPTVTSRRGFREKWDAASGIR